MIPRTANGAELLCNTLESLGVEHVFGVPGSQNVQLYQALSRSTIRSVLSTHELAASFMANGYYRASGKVAPVVTIQGPGFTYALTGLAEALHDSAAVLHLVNRPDGRADRTYEFQALDQPRIAAPIVKRVLSVDRVDETPRVVAQAYNLAVSGEPGPVLLQWSREALADVPRHPRSIDRPSQWHDEEMSSSDSSVDEAAALLGAAKRPLLFVGQGASGASRLVQELAESICSPVFTTVSGRGVLPEDHRLALGFDFNRGDVRVLNKMIRSSDCVLAIGCKLSHVGTAHFKLELPQDRLIHMDASEEVLGANHTPHLAILGSAEIVVERLLCTVRGLPRTANSGWPPAEIEDWKRRLRIIEHTAVLEPVIRGVAPETAEALFTALRRALPRNGIVVTDSGLHQGLVRRHFDVLSPRGLITPTDFQSMGFGLPAAIGAKLAAPERPVVTVLGDGGFAMSGMELLTAVRERIPLTVIVLNDGRLNLIRLQQFSSFGGSESVDILNPDFEALATAVGARYARVDGNAEEVLRDAVRGPHVTLLEVIVGDSTAIRLSRAKGLSRQAARKLLGPSMVRWLKRRQVPGARATRAIPGTWFCLSEEGAQPPGNGATPNTTASLDGRSFSHAVRGSQNAKALSLSHSATTGWPPLLPVELV